ncbi:MAG TPA: hypothetical protein VFS41_03270 [Edaphobacter sp.]|nr:hypothetical protein [Edaphobacter sp.]
MIPSSALPNGDRQHATGKAVEETLNYAIPAWMSGTVFDEISVVVKTAPERARMGAKGGDQEVCAGAVSPLDFTTRIYSLENRLRPKRLPCMLEAR